MSTLPCVQGPWRCGSTGKPLVAWRETELALAAQAISGVLRAWETAWGLPADAMVPRCVAVADVVAPEAWRLLGTNGSGTAWYALDPGFEQRCASALWGVDRSSGPLAGAVQAACGADLLARCAACVQVRRDAPPSDPPAALPRAGRWSGVAEVLPGWTLRVLLDPEVMAGLLARAAPGPRNEAASARPLAPVADATAGMRLALQVRLADCELDMARLQDLQPGDVLRVGHPLKEPLAVRDAADRLLFTGFLARSSGRKAVELAPWRAPGADAAREVP